MLSLLTNCTSNTQTAKKNKVEYKDSVKIIDSCSYENCIIKQTNTKTIGEPRINEPIVIEFFSISTLIYKYGEDSMPERFKHDGRQLLYKTLDQAACYSDVIKSVLDTLGIHIEKKIKGNTLTFDYNQQDYTIALSYFKEHDGVILFKPGKKPILWNYDNGPLKCDLGNYIKKYFDR